LAIVDQNTMESIRIYVETGKKKVFVAAIDWPGWCRWGQNEEAATDSFLSYGERYAKAIEDTDLRFEVPTAKAELIEIERCEGNVSTDFGAPAIILEADGISMDQDEYHISKEILSACWKVFDKAVEDATGKELKKGPRGGGRDLDKIIEHILAADHQYLKRMASKHKRESNTPVTEEICRMRQGVLGALEVAERGELPEKGPRGGLIWPPRFFVRRVAWHILDHAWELEDRIIE